MTDGDHCTTCDHARVWHWRAYVGTGGCALLTCPCAAYIAPPDPATTRADVLRGVSAMSTPPVRAEYEEKIAAILDDWPKPAQALLYRLLQAAGLDRDTANRVLRAEKWDVG